MIEKAFGFKRAKFVELKQDKIESMRGNTLSYLV